jgi:adenylate cyclase
VTVQLVRVADDGVRAIWSDEFRSETDDPFDLQERLATRLLDNLPVQITGEERAQYATEAGVNALALRRYTEGRFFLNRRVGDAVERALELFTQAAAIDPEYPRAFLGQARALNALIESGDRSREPALTRVRQALARAIELDPGLGEAYGFRSLLHRVYDWQFEAAEADSQRSLDLAPNNAEVLQWRGVHLLAIGRGDEAVRLHRRAVDIDPADIAVRAHLCRGQFLAGRFEEAIEACRMLIQMSRESGIAHQWLGLAQVELRQMDAALQALEHAVGLEPENPDRMAALAYGYARAGRGAEARRLISRLPPADSAYARALVLLALGDTPGALSELERAWKERDGFFASRARLDPRLDPIREEPRVRALLDRLR